MAHDRTNDITAETPTQIPATASLEDAMKLANNISEAFRTSLKTSPGATIGLVAAAGFFLGAIWRR